MIPIRDENPTRRVPFVNYALIVINVLVFLWQVSLGPSSDVALYQLALIPLDVTSGFDMGDVRSVFTSMFMHAGLMHLLGNMLYLWIFGDNVEICSVIYVTCCFTWLGFCLDLRISLPNFNSSNGWCQRRNRCDVGCLSFIISKSSCGDHHPLRVFLASCAHPGLDRVGVLVPAATLRRDNGFRSGRVRWRGFLGPYRRICVWDVVWPASAVA